MKDSLIQELKQLIALQDKLLSLLNSDAQHYKSNDVKQIAHNQHEIAAILTSVSNLSNNIFKNGTDVSNMLKDPAADQQQLAYQLVTSVREKAQAVNKQLSINSQITQSNLLDLKLIWDQLTSLASDNNCTYDEQGNLK